MKLIIAGGRDYQFTDKDKHALDELHKQTPVTQVVSGGNTGADACGEAWARANGIPVRVFHAESDKHGKDAGPIRNWEMAKYADAVALFPGGRGTLDMYEKAVVAKLQVFDYGGCARPDVPLGFGLRFKRLARWWLPVWLVVCVLPLLAGDAEQFAALLFVGTPMLCGFVAAWAGLRHGLDVGAHELRRRCGT